MEQTALKYISPEEFLAMEEKADTRNEYYQGEIFNMAGGTSNHNLIVSNLHAPMFLKLRKTGCTSYMLDMLLRIDVVDLFTYPDIMVVCGKPIFYEDRKNILTNPLLIVEVLSESTRNYDRGDKFEFYRKIPTFKEYVLVDQYKVHVEHFQYNDDGKWIFSEYNEMSGKLELGSLDFQISLADIYHSVEFEEK